LLDSKLYLWGSLQLYVYGIGLGDNIASYAPTNVFLAGGNPVSASISSYNAFVLLTNGVVYGFGDNTKQQVMLILYALTVIARRWYYYC
jgi:hypothetical protein